MNQRGAVIFHSSAGTSSLERMMSEARAAAACDLVDRLQQHLSTIVVVCSPDESARFAALGVDVVPARKEGFHFGEVLKRVIVDFELASLVYFGSGSGCTLSADQVQDIVHFAQRADAAALFNNFYSCDFAAISDTRPLLAAAIPKTDNGLGFLLADAGVNCHSLPRSLASQFDLDTPIDTILLKDAQRGGFRLSAFLETQTLVHPTLPALKERLVDRTALVYLVGRVSPVTWQAFERQVACRTAGIIEGRGMKAYADRQPPVLTHLLQESGFEPFFDALERSCDGAIIDSRPLLARQGVLPSGAERFSSDLFQVSRLHDPLWVEFTERALACSIPILLGGHSLVSGGLYLLSETCWKGRNLPRRLHPDPYVGHGGQHEPVPGQEPDRH